MNIIILQHIKIEDPGYIKDLMLADGLNLTTIELDEGEKIPNDLSKFDGMFCMGGPMDTFMEKEYPWLIEEKKRIKELVGNLKKPYLGFCLGCQLLGEVVGGKVVKSSPAEIGMMDINFTKEKNQDDLFSKFPDKIKSLQWHSYEVQGLENYKDVPLLASSNVTKYQIFRYQNHEYGLQFHIEIKDKTATIKGPSKLMGAEVMATDLRASVSLVLAGLVAENRTIINRIYHLDRGYEFLEKKLKNCNAEIKRI